MKKTTRLTPARLREIKNKAAEAQFGSPEREVSIPRLLRKLWVKE
jgi:hypothetical protein